MKTMNNTHEYGSYLGINNKDSYIYVKYFDGNDGAYRWRTLEEDISDVVAHPVCWQTCSTDDHLVLHIPLLLFDDVLNQGVRDQHIGDCD